MKKTIWMFNHYANLPGRGGSLRHFNLAKELVKNGYEVYVFASSAGHNFNYNAITDKSLFVEEKNNGVNFVYIRTSNYNKNGLKRIKNILEYSFRMMRVGKLLIKQKKTPDVIIGSSMHPLAPFIGYKLSEKIGCKFIAEIRDLWPETLLMYRPDFNSLLMRFFYKLEKGLYERADAIIFTMEGGKDYIKMKGWDKEIPLRKVYYINNGVDLNAFKYNKENFRIDDVDLENGELFKVIYTGAIGKTNNILKLVDVAELLCKKGLSQIKILIWGQGTESLILKEEIEKRKLRNIAYKGYTKKENIPYILCSADITLLHHIPNYNLHKYGTSLNKKFDYLAAGKPIINTCKVAFDPIEEEGAGVVLEEQTVSAIADAIILFYEMPKAKYREYGENARRIAMNYDFSELSKTMASAIEGVCKEDE